MTPNHEYTPIDDRERAQAAPGGRQTGQRPTDHQPPGTGQPEQTQSWQQAPRQRQPASVQQGPIRQTPVQQALPPQDPGGRGHPHQFQQPHPTEQSQAVQQSQQPPQSHPAQGPQIQRAQQPETGATPGQQQIAGVPSQPATGGAADAAYRQPAGDQPPRQPLLKPIRVNQIITEDVVTAERDTPVRTVVAQMNEHNVGSVVVVEEERPIGIITDRVVALAIEEMPDVAGRTADELLHGDVFTADPSMSIFDAIEVMSDEGIRRLPIVDDNGMLRGIVTLDDALVLLGGVVSEVADTVRSQSPRL